MAITVKVELRDLIAAHACQEGADLFAATYPDGYKTTWTPEAQKALITGPCRKFVGWAVRGNILPQINLAGANLAGANLTRANLYGADLTRAIDYVAPIA